MAARRQHTANVQELELEIDRLLAEQIESLVRPLLSITHEEAVQFAAGRDMLTALLKQLAHLRGATPSDAPDNDARPSVSTP